MSHSETPQNTPTMSKTISAKFKLLNLVDPRSPTTAFPRTPIQVVMQTPNKSVESIEEVKDSDSVEALHNDSHVSCSLNSTFANELNSSKSTSNCSSSFVNDRSIEIDDDIISYSPSPVVSDFNMSEPLLKDDEETFEMPETPKPERDLNLDNEYDSKNDKTPENFIMDREFNVKQPAKKLFFTPNNKKRTPLGVVDNICPVSPSQILPSSPNNVLRTNQWKRINEERKKLGLEADENIPLPLCDVTASAPSKLTLRKMRMQNRI